MDRTETLTLVVCSGQEKLPCWHRCWRHWPLRPWACTYLCGALPFRWVSLEAEATFAKLLSLQDGSESIWLEDWAWGAEEFVLETEKKCSLDEGRSPARQLPSMSLRLYKPQSHTSTLQRSGVLLASSTTTPPYLASSTSFLRTWPVIFPQVFVPSLLFLMGIRFKSSACTAKFLLGVMKKPDTSIPITTAHIVMYNFLRQILSYFIIFYFKLDYMLLTQLFGHLN